MKIENKLQMYELYEKGDFGNKFPCWNNLEDYLASGYEEPVALRHKTNGLSGFFLPNLTKEEVKKKIEFMALGRNEIHITACAPDELRTIQGEVVNNENGTELFYSYLKKPMRQALKEGGIIATGLRAISLIAQHFDINSYENLIDLFQKYPEHVVEFTCFRRSVGELRWNTVVWEVRSY
jgi:hypothetical protein